MTTGATDNGETWFTRQLHIAHERTKDLPDYDDGGLCMTATARTGATDSPPNALPAPLEDKPQRLRSGAYALCFAASLPQLQAVARKQGYALAVHGSMATDFDLIACPWTEEATDAETLAAALCECVGGHVRLLEGRLIGRNPGWKPHGRLAYSFYLSKTPDGLTSYGPYLDLSIMPRTTPWLTPAEDSEGDGPGGVGSGMWTSKVCEEDSR